MSTARCVSLLALLATSLPTTQTASAASPVERQTRLGTVLGADNSSTSGTYAWLGVPYAKPPVGALRWMPPAPADAWHGKRNAQTFGPACVQAGRFYSPAPNSEPFGLAVRDSIGKTVGSEDCLTLNLWRPASDAKQLPVIVFIHGGSNISGYTADPLYEGAKLAKHADALVVSINYRLGIFGWLNLAQLKNGDPQVDSGNFATLDQVQALEFVKQNAQVFGGDPNNITVMGQSAGAVNTWALLVSPLAQGLFHRAVPLSGGLMFTSPATSRTYAETLLAALAVADGTAADQAAAKQWISARTPMQVAAYLRGKSTDELLKVTLANRALALAPAVITDGMVVPSAPLEAIAAGRYRKMPILVGNTRDEGTLFGTLLQAYKPSEYERFTLQFNFDPNVATRLTEADFLNPAFLPVDKIPGGWKAASANITNMFVGQAKLALDAVGKQQPGQLWYYRFDWDHEPAPFNTVYGATHTLDLPFVFGTFGRSVFSFAWSAANQQGREQLSEKMMRSIAAFARTGNPNHPALGVSWPNWPATLIFDASPAQAQISVK